MLSLLSLASAEICWQLEVDMGMAALLEVGCRSLGCRVQSTLVFCDGEMTACQC